MKRLLVLAAVVLAAGASGCRNCGRTTAARPCCPPAPSCCAPTESFGSYGAPVYSTPGAVMAPTLSEPTVVPAQTFPGPEAYTPAM
jgi:hypothetical protein